MAQMPEENMIWAVSAQSIKARCFQRRRLEMGQTFSAILVKISKKMTAHLFPFLFSLCSLLHSAA